MILTIIESTNRKTGDIPQIIIGQEEEETVASCKAVGCNLRPKKYGGDGGCYAYKGLTLYGLRSAIKAKRYAGLDGLKHALALRRLKDSRRRKREPARAVRLGMIGDPAGLPPDYLELLLDICNSAAYPVIAYTHGWRDRFDLAEEIRASCDSPAEADEAVAAGWKATCIVDKETERVTYTPEGHKVVVCPAQLSDSVTCNTCRQCLVDGDYPTIIGFRKH
jgi:hypothetical protein